MPHYHLHCVIPGVGIKKDGSVHVFKENFLFPNRVIGQVFRGLKKEAFDLSP